MGKFVVISVGTARRLVKRQAAALVKTESKSLADSLGCVVAEDIFTAIPLPLYDNAAMDGFCFRSKDSASASSKSPVSFRIRGVIKAGDSGNRRLGRPCQAYKIMTGAPLPKNADAVLPIEHAVVRGNVLVVDRPAPAGNHVRYRGEEAKKGCRLLLKNSFVHPATAGILAMIGKTQVKVFRKPRVSLIATGSELVKLGSSLSAGQIYDSNSPMIESALRAMGIPIMEAFRIPDRAQLLRRAVKRALRQSDVLILAGGVSAGEYDYVKDVLKGLGVKTVFWKVSQKPGKPLFFGTAGGALVFGLPGNPASVFTCFYEYVFPAIRLMSGFRRPDLRRAEAGIQTSITPDRSKTLFLKAKASFGESKKTVTLLRRQGSHMISSLQEANCFIVIPPAPPGRRIEKGEGVRIDLLPFMDGAL